MHARDRNERRSPNAPRVRRPDPACYGFMKTGSLAAACRKAGGGPGSWTRGLVGESWPREAVSSQAFLGNPWRWFLSRWERRKTAYLLIREGCGGRKGPRRGSNTCRRGQQPAARAGIPIPRSTGERAAASEGLSGSACAGFLGNTSCAAIPSHDESCTERACSAGCNESMGQHGKGPMGEKEIAFSGRTGTNRYILP
jgi:hypothetical protein